MMKSGFEIRHLVAEILVHVRGLDGDAEIFGYVEFSDIQILDAVDRTRLVLLQVMRGFEQIDTVSLTLEQACEQPDRDGGDQHQRQVGIDNENPECLLRFHGRRTGHDGFLVNKIRTLK